MGESMSEIVNFNRATSTGWKPVTGVKVGPLAVAEYDESSGFNIFHIETGMTIPNLYFEKRLPAIKAAKKFANRLDWSVVKKKGLKPGKIEMPDEFRASAAALLKEMFGKP